MCGLFHCHAHRFPWAAGCFANVQDERQESDDWQGWVEGLEMAGGPWDMAEIEEYTDTLA